jgi:hypothetical protein
MKYWGVAAMALMLAGGAANAAEKPFLDGTFYLDMTESKWGGGVNGAAGAPEASGKSFITGAVWHFDKDDGAHRKGYLTQTLRSGKIQVFYYDVDYDGKLHWLNDWYMEGNKRLDDNSFSTVWEVHKDGIPVIKGDPDVCKINTARDKFSCDGSGLHEVYSKSATPPKMP